MSWSDYYDAGFLTPDDVGESWTATIADVEQGEFTDDDGEVKHQAVLVFRGTKLKFRANVTNKQLLEAIWPDERKSIGEKVTLTTEQVKFGKEMVPGIRVKGSPTLLAPRTVTITLPRKRPFERQLVPTPAARTESHDPAS